MCSLYDPRDLWHITTTVTTLQVAWFCPQKALLLEQKHEVCGQLLASNSMPRCCSLVHLNASRVSYNSQAYLHKQKLRIMAKTFNHKYLQVKMLLLYVSFNFVSDFQLHVKIFPSTVLQLIRKKPFRQYSKNHC